MSRKSHIEKYHVEKYLYGKFLNENICHKSNFFGQKNFDQKSKFWSKIEILLKNPKF